MHHMAVALDKEAAGDFDPAHLGHPAHIIAAQIHQHQMFGPFLGIGHQFLRQLLVFGGGLAARAGAGDRTDGDLAIAQANQDFRAGANNGKARHGEIIKKGRGVQSPERPVKRKRRQGECAAEALAGHHLKHIARRDIFLGARDHGEIFRLGHVGLNFAHLIFRG